MNYAGWGVWHESNPPNSLIEVDWRGSKTKDGEEGAFNVFQCFIFNKVSASLSNNIKDTTKEELQVNMFLTVN